MNAAPPRHDAIYPLPYAARLAGLDINTARRWTRGYQYRFKGETRQSQPLLGMVAPGTPSVSGTTAGKDLVDGVTFEALLTLRLVRAFRTAGLGLATIRAAAQVAVTRYGVGNPFVTKMFRTDGRKVFLELQKTSHVRGDERVMVEALSGQQQFKDVVEPSLFEHVLFLGDAPIEWRPGGRSVVIRPDRAFGAPHIEGTGIRTDVLADAVAAEGGGPQAVTVVATWFGVTEDQVRDAIAVEGAWQQAA